ncbi:MAG: hypothetical protein HFK09_07185 [Clostridia bacterium]|nr:hypothetical protein [Clostridia bacterium]
MQKQRMRQSIFMAIWLPVVAVVCAAMITVTVLMNMYSKVMDFVFGAGKMVITKAEGTEDWDTDYYTSGYDTREKLLAAAEALTEEIAGEGFVLLKNKSNTLPIATSKTNPTKINCFGWGFSHPVYGGTGSGKVKTATSVTPQKGLENAGFTVNPTLVAAYDDWSKDDANMLGNAVNTGNGTSNALMSAFKLKPRVSKSADERPTTEFGYGNWDLIEAPASALDMAQAKSYSDIALIMIGRVGGEQGDLPMEMGENAFYGRGEGKKYGYNPDKHYLELTDEEEALIAAVKEQDFDKIILVVNSANVMELGDVEKDDKIGAVIYAPGPGQTGFNALGRILSGEVNPSGKTADIFPADFTKNPSFCNFADPYNYAYNPAAMRDAGVGKRNSYNNIDKTNSWDTGFFTQYEEGIYVGYRYYETAADIGKEGFDYDTEVVYPFGYGLSYTTFTQKIVGKNLGGDDMSVDVKVTNTGAENGKSAVQLYVTAPYIQGGVEKSTASLIAFGKTKMLAPGESDTVMLTFTKDDLTSYDYKDNKCYILDEGDYVFSLRANSHDVIDGQTVSWHNSRKMIYNAEHDGARRTEKEAQGQRPEENYVPATNAFDESNIKQEMDKMTILTRADKFAKMPEAPTDVDRTASEQLIAAVAKFDVKTVIDESDTEKIKTDAEKTLSLVDMRGLDADDPAWERLMDQMSLEEIIHIIVASGYGSPAASSVGLPELLHGDGPQGISLSWAGVEGALDAPVNAYTCEVALAGTFNVELAHRMGEMVGAEAIMVREVAKRPFSVWYAPGADMHRSPFGGRNFEYFSEDPLLSGKLVAAEIGGATGKGLWVMLKHFALNDQETYRGGWGYASSNCLYTWADEQTIREIYLKPFEMAVKEATCEVKYISDDNGGMSTRTIRACTGLMSSFNAIGSTWAGGNKELMTDVVRGEWNFEGVVITDFKNQQRAYMDLDQMIHSGADVALATVPEPGEEWLTISETDKATTLKAAREAVKHFLYAAAHSNAMNGLAPGSIISYTLAPWQICLIIASVIIYAAAVTIIVLTVLRLLDSRKHPENYKSKK